MFTIEQARSVLAHYRDKFRLSNRDLAWAFQDKVSPDALINFMRGDNSALTGAQQSYIGNEAVDWVNAEDLDREQMKRRGLEPEPGVREVIGLSKGV